MPRVSLPVILILTLIPVGLYANGIRPKLLSDVKVAVRAKLRDPDSVRILKTVLVHTKDMNGHPADVVCGTLTARNNSGGMSSAAKFVYFLKFKDAVVLKESIVLQPYLVNDWSVEYQNFCGGTIVDAID